MKASFYILILLLICSTASGQTTKKPATKPAKSTKTTKTTKTTKPAAPVKQGPSVLLVKIKSLIVKDQLGALSLRDPLEDKIDEQLQATKNGEWMSGDSGPGEINMLFKVQNVDQAMKLILKIVSEEKFEKTIIIGIRTSTDIGQWKYKPIYPPNYKGTL